eukprot:8442571-Alexandrium_andersonii.AAC.1
MQQCWARNPARPTRDPARQEPDAPEVGEAARSHSSSEPLPARRVEAGGGACDTRATETRSVLNPERPACG